MSGDRGLGGAVGAGAIHRGRHRPRAEGLVVIGLRLRRDRHGLFQVRRTGHALVLVAYQPGDLGGKHDRLARLGAHRHLHLGPEQNLVFIPEGGYLAGGIDETHRQWPGELARRVALGQAPVHAGGQSAVTRVAPVDVPARRDGQQHAQAQGRTGDGGGTVGDQPGLHQAVRRGGSRRHGQRRGRHRRERKHEDSRPTHRQS